MAPLEIAKTAPTEPSADDLADARAASFCGLPARRCPECGGMEFWVGGGAGGAVLPVCLSCFPPADGVAHATLRAAQANGRLRYQRAGGDAPAGRICDEGEGGDSAGFMTLRHGDPSGYWSADGKRLPRPGSTPWCDYGHPTGWRRAGDGALLCEVCRPPMKEREAAQRGITVASLPRWREPGVNGRPDVTAPPKGGQHQ